MTDVAAGKATPTRAHPVEKAIDEVTGKQGGGGQMDSSPSEEGDRASRGLTGQTRTLIRASSHFHKRGRNRGMIKETASPDGEGAASMKGKENHGQGVGLKEKERTGSVHARETFFLSLPDRGTIAEEGNLQTEKGPKQRRSERRVGRRAPDYFPLFFRTRRKGRGKRQAFKKNLG